jgi:predicted DNA-binding transcriptional regulator YafY
VDVRASRLVSTVMLLRSRERWTARELSEELGVSVRTVYRDVSELQLAGVPLWTESGPGGGVRLLAGWRNDLDALTVEEAAALTLSGVPAALGDLGLGAVALSARLKVRSTLPRELRSRAARVEERFHLDAPGWFHHPDDVAHLAEIAEAVWSARRLDVTYRRDPEPVRRRLDPLGLVLKAGTWYLVARHRATVRTYRIGRVLSCRTRDETFDRPEGFDLAAWWSGSSAEFDRSLLRTTCRLALSPAACRQLPHVTDTAAAARAVDGSLPWPGDDRPRWVVVDLECESDVVAAHQLVALGDGVEVLEPTAVRDRLHEVGTAMARANRPRVGDQGHG